MNIWIYLGFGLALILIIGLAGFIGILRKRGMFRNWLTQQKCSHQWIYVTIVNKVHIYICKSCRKIREELAP